MVGDFRNILSLTLCISITGLASLCTIVSDVVGTLVDNIELHQQLCLSELEGLLNRGFEKLKLLQEEDNILRNPGAFFLPSTDLFLHDVALCEKEELKKMFAETLDVIECEDSVNTVNKLCRYDIPGSIAGPQ